MNIKKELSDRNPQSQIYKFISPGRINLIGEHIDYVGGKVVPAAIDLSIEAFATKSDKVSIKSLNFGKEWQQLDIGDIKSFKYDNNDSFLSYVKGIFLELSDKISNNQGFELILSSSIPVSSGLSSSAAFGALVIEILDTLYDLKLSKKEKALIFQRVENNFINLKSGIMDQFAIEFGKKDNFIYLDTSNLDYKYIKSSPDNYKFILFSTNKSRELAGSAYNERVDQLMEVSKIINVPFKELSNNAKMSDLSKIEDVTLSKRLRHVLSENDRVKKIANGLQSMNGEELGTVLIESHESLQKNYEVSCHELDFIHNNLQTLEGYYGGRMIGAGFGGCYLAVVKKEFDIKKIRFNNDYKNEFGFFFDVYEFEITEGVYGKKD